MDSVLFPTAASAPAVQSTAPFSALLSAVWAEKQALPVPSFPLNPVKTLCNYVFKVPI